LQNTVQCAVPSKREIASQLKSFGANLRRERIAREMTQEKLSELSDLNIRTLQSIEAGEMNLLVTTAMRIQRALKVDWERLLP
jgi:transcriptional regulator with XRE-family HTH domain